MSNNIVPIYLAGSSAAANVYETPREARKRREAKKSLTSEAARSIIPPIGRDGPRLAANEGSRGNPTGARREGEDDGPVAFSQDMDPVKFPEVLNMNLGDWTEEYGPAQKKNKMCCLVTEAARSSNAVKRLFDGRTPNGKALCFTGSGLTITLNRRRARYVFKDDTVLFDVVRFDDGALAYDGRHKRRVQAFLVSPVEDIPQNSDERRAQINKARRELRVRRRQGIRGPAQKRNRMEVARRHLRQRGYEV